MILSQIEKELHIKFPKKWWEIYDMGAMEWMELGFWEFQERREEYISNPKSFL